MEKKNDFIFEIQYVAPVEPCGRNGWHVQGDGIRERYNWENTFNTRDLGYTPTATGRYIKFQRFIRSDAPCKIEDDVRFSTYNFPLSIDSKVAKSEEDVIENYYRMIENDKVIFQIFHTMADSEGGILFHCQEGKDRTGIISALLLLLGGVADIDIIADYEISNAYLYQMTQIAKNVPGGIPAFLLYIKSEYMDAVLSYLRDKYGTIENYLLKKGILQTEIEMLKRKLLE